MANANIEEKVKNLIEPIIQSLGYDLYDIEYVKEGKNYFLRIFIDQPNGIDLNDCEKVNNAINDILDEADFIQEQYFLEVSSPGIERVLKTDKHLQDYIGNLVEVKLFKALKKQKVWQGILIEFDSDDLKMKTNEEVIIIDRKNIALVKTIFNW